MRVEGANQVSGRVESVDDVDIIALLAGYFGLIGLLMFMMLKSSKKAVDLEVIAVKPSTTFPKPLANVLKAIILKTSYDIEGEKKEQMYRELAEMREKRHEENETA